MKLTVRIAIVAVGTVLLVPTIAFAQPFLPGGGYVGTGPYNYSAQQSYSGGSSMFGPFSGGFGAMFPGGFGMGGFGSGFGMGGFGMGGSGGGSMGFGVVGLASTVIIVINSVLVPLLFAVSFIVFLYGIAKAYILAPGDEEAVKSGHKILLWGLIGFAVMVSVWGIVNVVVATFGLAVSSGSSYPTSFG